MTANQINYARYREEERANRVKEVQNEQALNETQRANLAREAENSRANTLNYEASIYNAQASMYNAQLNYNANVMATQQRETASQRQQDIADADRAVSYLNAGISGVSKLIDTAMTVVKYLAA